jgi:hypothetical protein
MNPFHYVILRSICPLARSLFVLCARHAPPFTSSLAERSGISFLCFFRTTLRPYVFRGGAITFLTDQPA